MPSVEPITAEYVTGLVEHKVSERKTIDYRALFRAVLIRKKKNFWLTFPPSPTPREAN